MSIVVWFDAKVRIMPPWISVAWRARTRAGRVEDSR